jgi:hypothetical protein
MDYRRRAPEPLGFELLPDERLPPVEDRELPPDDRLLPAEDRELPPDDRLPPADERERLGEDRLLPTEDREPPPVDRVPPTDLVLGAVERPRLLPTELGEREVDPRRLDVPGLETVGRL